MFVDTDVCKYRQTPSFKETMLKMIDRSFAIEDYVLSVERVNGYKKPKVIK